MMLTSATKLKESNCTSSANHDFGRPGQTGTTVHASDPLAKELRELLLWLTLACFSKNLGRKRDD